LEDSGTPGRSITSVAGTGPIHHCYEEEIFVRIWALEEMGRIYAY